MNGQKKILFAGFLCGDNFVPNVVLDLFEFVRTLGPDTQVLMGNLISPSYCNLREEISGIRPGFSAGEVEQTNRELINQATHLVAPLFAPNISIGVQIGLAMANGIPVLCLYEKKDKFIVSWIIQGMEQNCYPGITIAGCSGLAEAISCIEKFLQETSPLDEISFEGITFDTTPELAHA